MRRKLIKKILMRSFIGFSGAVILYGMLLYHPEPAFPFVVTDRNLILRADRPFAREDGAALLRKVHGKLCESPFFRQDARYQICICQTAWRRRLFFSCQSQAGGLCYPGSFTVFLSGADLDENRLLAPSGRLVMDERTLDYFMAHELTHSMVDDSIGTIDFLMLPTWIKEGYADYIGRGGVFCRPGARQAYLTDASEMTTPARAPYLRYNFLVSYVLDQLQRSHSQLHFNPVLQSTIEMEARQFLIDVSDPG